MKGAGIDPKTRPTTGQDAELAAIQRILLGEQYMTVYKAISSRLRQPRGWQSLWPRVRPPVGHDTLESEQQASGR